MTTICSSCGDLLWSHLEIRLDPSHTVHSRERKTGVIIQNVLRVRGTVRHAEGHRVSHGLSVSGFDGRVIYLSLCTHFLSLCIKPCSSSTLKLSFQELVLKPKVCYSNRAAPYEKDPSFCVTPFFNLSFCTYGRHQSDCGACKVHLGVNCLKQGCHQVHIQLCIWKI